MCFEAGGDGGTHGSRAGTHSELGQDVTDVGFDRANAEKERFGNDAIGLTGDKLMQDLHLPRGEPKGGCWEVASELDWGLERSDVVDGIFDRQIATSLPSLGDGLFVQHRAETGQGAVVGPQIHGHLERASPLFPE